tara:strand:+ start:9121 stop:10467 length:1347 start_codon:yes stop_codon:yes gene_type:complete
VFAGDTINLIWLGFVNLSLAITEREFEFFVLFTLPSLHMFQLKKERVMTKTAQPQPFKFRNGYRAQVTNPTTKKRETKDFSTRREAQLWIHERLHALATLSKGRLGGPEMCTLAEFLIEYAHSNILANAGYVQELNRVSCYLEAAGLKRIKAVKIGEVVRIEEQEEVSEKMAEYLKKARESIEPVWELRAELASKLCSELTRDDFAQLQSTMALCGNSPSTIQKEIALIRAAFNEAIANWGWTAFKNPTAGFTLGKSKVVIPKYEIEQVADLVVKAKEHSNSHIAPVIELALETLVRKGQLVSLRWSDIDFANSCCTVRIKKSARAGGETTTIPLTRHAVGVLRSVHAQNPDSNLVFEGLTAEMLDNAFESLREKVGLTALRFHDLRHIGATLCARANMSAHQLRLMLGHKTLNMALVYVNLAVQDVKNFLDGHMGGAVFNLERTYAA